MIEIREYIDELGTNHFGKDGEQLIILLGGGTKKRQQQDIYKAQQFWQEYKIRKSREDI